MKFLLGGFKTTKNDPDSLCIVMLCIILFDCLNKLCLPKNVLIHVLCSMFSYVIIKENESHLFIDFYLFWVFVCI